MLRYCERLTRKICGDSEAVLREFNGETGRVHLLLEHPPKASALALVNNLKGSSARRPRAQHAVKVDPRG